VQPFKLGPKGSTYSLPGITSRQHNTGIAQSRAHLELGCTKLRLPEINRHPQYRAPLCVAALQKGRGGRTTECIMLVRRGSVLCLVLLCEVVTRHVCAVRWSVMRAVCDVRRCVLRGGVCCAAVCAVRWWTSVPVARTPRPKATVPYCVTTAAAEIESGAPVSANPRPVCTQALAQALAQAWSRSRAG
jgi:hypothetical protein